MKIVAENLGKRYNFNWIFRNINLVLEQGQAYAVIGHNGSGKSTLLQILAGIQPCSEGKLAYTFNNKMLSPDLIYQHLVIASPYMELIEEFTLKEHLQFHYKFKPLRTGFRLEELPQLLWLEKSLNKPIRYFSSGMKQRVKLGLAFFSDTPILLLDEPASNLDRTGIQWYRQQIDSQRDRLILVGSNQEEEYAFCDHHIRMAASL